MGHRYCGKIMRRSISWKLLVYQVRKLKKILLMTKSLSNVCVLPTRDTILRSRMLGVPFVTSAGKMKKTGPVFWHLDRLRLLANVFDRRDHLNFHARRGDHTLKQGPGQHKIHTSAGYSQSYKKHYRVCRGWWAPRTTGRIRINNCSALSNLAPVQVQFSCRGVSYCWLKWSCGVLDAASKCRYLIWYLRDT